MVYYCITSKTVDPSLREIGSFFFSLLFEGKCENSILTISFSKRVELRAFDTNFRSRSFTIRRCFGFGNKSLSRHCVFDSLENRIQSIASILDTASSGEVESCEVLYADRNAIRQLDPWCIQKDWTCWISCITVRWHKMFFKTSMLRVEFLIYVTTETWFLVWCDGVWGNFETDWRSVRSS